MDLPAIINSDASAIVIVVALVLIWLLPDKVTYLLTGTLLLIFGILPLLTYFGAINFDMYSYPISYYIVLYIAITGGEVLVYESLHEQVILKMLSMILGVVIVILTAIPTLKEIGAISFALPEYSPIINAIIYLTAGILLVIGAIKFSKSA